MLNCGVLEELPGLRARTSVSLRTPTTHIHPTYLTGVSAVHSLPITETGRLGGPMGRDVVLEVVDPQTLPKYPSEGLKAESATKEQ